MAMITIFTKFIGNKYFHSKVNNWSTRNLGKVHLNHIIKKIMINTFIKNQIDSGNQAILSVIPKGDNHPPKNNTTAIEAIMNILINSAKKK